MAKEVLTVPEEYLVEVIEVVRAGLAAARAGAIQTAISEETIDSLQRWCDEEEDYLGHVNAGWSPAPPAG